MLTLMVMGLFYTLYGIAGLSGFQIIPEKYNGQSWTKDYIRCRGIAWLMIGVPWFALYWLADICFADVHTPEGSMIVAAGVLAIPSLIYAVVCDKKYKALLEKDADSKPTEEIPSY